MDSDVACLKEMITRSGKKNFWAHVAVNPDFSHYSFHNNRGLLILFNFESY